jgi:hypothetical protein
MATIIGSAPSALSIDRARARKVVMGLSSPGCPGIAGSAGSIPSEECPIDECGPAASRTALIRRLSGSHRGGSIGR